MDLLIISTVAIVGHELNKRLNISKNNTNNKITKNTKQLTIDDVNKITKDRILTHNNMVPFIKSKNMNNYPMEDDTRKLELFTGRELNTDIKKKEIKPHFDPFKNNNATSYHNNKVDISNERYQSSQYHTNALPFEQARIGPGLGKHNIDIEASGGFHNQFRILPDNVNEYRVNKGMEGRVIFGKAVNDKRTDIENESKYFDKTTYLNQRPLMEGKASIDGPAQYNVNNIRNTMKDACKTFENPTGLNRYGTNQYGSNTTISTRGNDHSFEGFVGNPSREDMGQLNENTVFVVKDTDRGVQGQVTNLINSTGSYATYDDEAKRTLRQHTQCSNYNSNAISNVPTTYENNYQAKHVKRETYPCSQNPGGLSSLVKSETINNHHLQNTKRNEIDEKQMNRINIIQGMKQVPNEIQSPQNVIQNDKRGSTSYTPGMGRVNLLPNACFANGQTHLKNDAHDTPHVEITNIKSINNFSNSKHMGCTQLRKSQNINDRLGDFTILQDQIKNNPYYNKTSR